MQVCINVQNVLFTLSRESLPGPANGGGGGGADGTQLKWAPYNEQTMYLSEEGHPKLSVYWALKLLFLAWVLAPDVGYFWVCDSFVPTNWTLTVQENGISVHSAVVICNWSPTGFRFCFYMIGAKFDLGKWVHTHFQQSLSLQSFIGTFKLLEIQKNNCITLVALRGFLI